MQTLSGHCKLCRSTVHQDSSHTIHVYIYIFFSFFLFIVTLNSIRKTRGIMNFHALFFLLPHSGSCTWTRWCSTDCSVTQSDQRPVQSSCIIHWMQSEYVNCGLQSKVSVHSGSARLCWMHLPDCNARRNSMSPSWKWTNKKCRVFVDPILACDWLVRREEVRDSLEPCIPDFSRAGNPLAELH